jgi:hypothetical protein
VEGDARATLTVERTLPIDIGQRHVDLYLDGVRIGSLENGRSLTREIGPGPHQLKAHNTLVGKTVAFTAEPGGHVRFATANRAGFGSWLIWYFGAGPMYVVLEQL